MCNLLCTKFSLQVNQMVVCGKRRAEATKGATWERQADKDSDAFCGSLSLISDLI